MIVVKNNFKKYILSVIDILGMFYDYGFVMYYGVKYFFKNG